MGHHKATRQAVFAKRVAVELSQLAAASERSTAEREQITEETRMAHNARNSHYPRFADPLTDESSRKSKMGPLIGEGKTYPSSESLFGVPTWAGRPLSRWTRYGRYNEDGTLTVTRIM